MRIDVWLCKASSIDNTSYQWQSPLESAVASKQPSSPASPCMALLENECRDEPPGQWRFSQYTVKADGQNETTRESKCARVA